MSETLHIQPLETLLGRLALDCEFQEHGLGERLLFSAMKRSLDAAMEIASLALVTDPKNKKAERFYRRYGFLPLIRKRLSSLFPAVALSCLTAGRVCALVVNKSRVRRPALFR